MVVGKSAGDGESSGIGRIERDGESLGLKREERENVRELSWT